MADLLAIGYDDETTAASRARRPFLVVEKMTTDTITDAMSKFGGTVLKSSLSKEAEHELQEALHGSGAAGSGQ